jgi:AraC-like DNA-binding protein
MDALSGVLKSVRLEGAFYLNAEFTAPWCMRGRFGLSSVRERLSGAEHLVLFHFVTEGRCKVQLVEGGEVLDLSAGDVVLFPQDDRHLMGSDLHVAPLDAERLDDEFDEVTMIRVRHGGGGIATRFVCGYLACTPSMSRPLFGSLPRLLRIPIADGQGFAMMRGLLQVGVRESTQVRPGAASMLAKLAELVLVEAMRRYVESLPPERHGWLAGLRDPQIGRALTLMHERPQRPWSVDELAREVAMSRSAFAERFAMLVGEPPMQYLTRWRLTLAAQELRAGDDALSRIAERIGYETETAFNRAFKREFGMPPAAWRRAGAAR